jgi:hypothetical protein
MLTITNQRTCSKSFKNACLALATLVGIMMSMAIQAAPPSPPGGLCITNSSGQVTCLQDSPVSATGGSSGTPSTGIIAPSSIVDPRKNFHPGYYMLVGYNGNKTDFDKIKDNPDFVGVNKVYIWRNIETAYGVYDFSQIEQDLAYLQSIGKRLILQIQYTEWNGTLSPRVPSYMWSLSGSSLWIGPTTHRPLVCRDLEYQRAEQACCALRGAREPLLWRAVY